ncbi:MAG: serine/threonine protein kinase [Streptomycetaceae bacterium]|nr:serine/threonine protein kinase [Streptomycetaceae bacterium]
MDQPAPDPPDLPDRFEPIELFGKGGGSEVWHCRDHVLDRDVAVKVLRPGRRRWVRTAFRDEAALTARAAGEHTVGVLDAQYDRRHGGQPYLAMEFLDGYTLHHRLMFGGALPVDQAAATAARIADAVATAHEAGVLHRDVKPANVMLTKQGAVKLIDFGYGAAKDNAAAVDDVSGTPGYMAPDKAQAMRSTPGALLRKPPPASERDDLYALGVVLYEMVIGKPAFVGKPKQKLKAQVKGDLPRLSQVVPGVPPELDALVASLTAKDPAERPGSAAAVRDRLTDIAKNAPHRIVGVYGPLRQAMAAGATIPPGTSLSGIAADLPVPPLFPPTYSDLRGQLAPEAPGRGPATPHAAPAAGAAKAPSLDGAVGGASMSVAATGYGAVGSRSKPAPHSAHRRGEATRGQASAQDRGAARGEVDRRLPGPADGIGN